MTEEEPNSSPEFIRPFVVFLFSKFQPPMCRCCNNHNLNKTVDRFFFFRSHRQRVGGTIFTKVRHCGTFCFLVLVYDHVHLVLASSSPKPNNHDPIKNKIHWSRRPQSHIAIDIAIHMLVRENITTI